MKFPATNLKRVGTTFLAFWASPWMAGISALLVYSIFSSGRGSVFRTTDGAYFNYLADAFLHGQLHLRYTPANLHDLVLFRGKLYLYWAPFPAILLMPLVAIVGIRLSDVFIVLVIAALTVAMVALLLKKLDDKGILLLDVPRRGLLVLFFALGSVLLPLTTNGGVWAMSEMIGFLFVTLAYIAATGLRGWMAFFLTGFALSCAAGTRNHLLFTGIWPAYYLLSTHWKEDRPRVVTRAFLGLVPVFLTIGALAWYNWARFGNPIDVGVNYHNMDKIFRADFMKYGYFNIHYIPVNIYYQYINYPFPWRSDSIMGGSLFLLSPVLFGAFWGIARGRSSLSVFFLMLSILITSIPILMLMGTGFQQIGPRYTLDFHIPLILLTAIGLKRWPIWLIGLLVFICCIHYFIGTLLYV
jgi:hypothetical protein